MSPAGNIEPFHVSGLSWDVYEDCLRNFLIAQDVKEARKIATVLSVMGGKTYSTLRSLLLPEKPETKSLDEIFATLRKHFCPRPSTVAERYRFSRRFQKEGEKFSDFVAELRQMTQYCKWVGQTLEENICNQFIVGLRNDAIRQRLFREMDVTLEEALNMANAEELSQREASEINPSILGSEAARQVAKFDSERNSPRPSFSHTKKGVAKCCHCGERSHISEHCRYSQVICFKCNKKGHLQKCCLSSMSAQGGPTNKSKRRCKQAKKVSSDLEVVTCDFDRVTVNQVKGQMIDQPFMTKLLVNGVVILMEIDSGAAVSILPEIMAKKLFPKQRLDPPGICLRSFTGKKEIPVGKFTTSVKFKGKIFENLEIFVVKQVTTALMGRSWINRLGILNYMTSAAVNLTNSNIVNKSDHSHLKALLDKHAKLFDGSLGRLLGMKARFTVKEGCCPKFFKARPVPFALRPAIEAELVKLEQQGIISPTEFSEWSAPVVPIIKKDKSIRLCGDYKVGLNPVLDIDFYPLPKIDDMFSQLSGGIVFSKLDLAQAYLQMEIEEESKKFVTINTIRGLYKVHCLPFGVASAPAIFQRAMEQILFGLKGVMCYLDDILITGCSIDEHFQNLDALFSRLDKAGIKLNKTKCEFLKSSIEYLGHVIDKDGLHASSSKILAIQQAPVPKNVTDLRSFLGLINYYRKFLPGLSEVLAPLNELLKKEQPWNWSKMVETAFNHAKQLITSPAVLTHFNPEYPVVLACDASAFGLGGVISHIFPDGSEHPIAFASRSLSPAEKGYAQIDKEALGIIFAVKRFHQFLYGRKFTLVTDHQPLTRIFGASNAIPTLAAARLQCWALILASYSYDIIYKNTKLHGNADGLSRSPPPYSSSTKLDEAEKPADIFLISQVELFPVDHKAIAKATVQDPILSKVAQFTQFGWSNAIDKELHLYHLKKEEISIQQGCLIWGVRVIIPKKLRQKVLEELHHQHTGTVKMKMLARSYFWWPGLDEDIGNITKSCSDCLTQSNTPAKAPLHPWVWPTKPWQRVHIDFAGPFRGTNFLVAVDAHSKWPEVYMMNSTTADKMVEVITNIMARFGIPEHIHTDNGSQFISHEFQEFCKQNGIRHTRSAPYHPATNGQAERFVQVLKRNLSRDNKNKTLTQHLNQLLFSYRTTPHSTTQETPAYLFLGRQLRTRLDLMRPSSEVRVHRSQDKQILSREKKGEDKKFEIGQLVMARVFANKEKWKPAIILDQTGPVSYRVRLESGLIWKRHQDQLILRSAPSIVTSEATPSISDADPLTQQAETPRRNPVRTKSKIFK